MATTEKSEDIYVPWAWMRERLEPSVLKSMSAAWVAAERKVRALEREIGTLERRAASIQQAFTPRCCHVTGEHSPTHFEKDPTRFCELQKAESWERIAEILGKPERAENDPDCYWCRAKKGETQ